MRFLSVDVENIGVYRGLHKFLLEPLDGPGDRRRNMTIIYGRNGSGKTTLCKSIQLALFGKLVLGDRVTQKQYQDFISRYLLDQSNGKVSGNPQGSVTVRFQYVKSSEPSDVLVKRTWEFESSSLKENLSVLVNGQEPDVLDEESRMRIMQEAVYDFIPPDLVDVCFFDAEKLDSLSSPEVHNQALGSVLRRFLGLDIIVRLYGDIEHYLDDYMRTEGGSKQTASLRKTLLDTQERLDQLRNELETRTSERQQLVQNKNKAETLLKRLERQLTAQGGVYAEKRRILQEQLNKLESQRQMFQDALADLCSELLPFSVVPELLLDLASSLKREGDKKRKELAADLFRETSRSLVEKMSGKEFWSGLKINQSTRDEVTERARKTIRSLESSGLEEDSVIFDITDVDRHRIPEWIRVATTEIPGKAMKLCSDLSLLDKTITRTRSKIDKAPDDVLLAKIHGEIQEAEQSLAAMVVSESILQETITTQQYRIGEAERELHVTRDKLIKAQSAEYNLDLANRSRLVLKTYEDALIRIKIKEIEDRIVENFNVLCHKSRLLSSVRINPDDYSVNLFSENDRSVFLTDLSAGERQLYAVSLLWALRQVSGKDIPLFVDTPVAKLDETHGWQLIHEYFPKVSEQVIIFAHTKEMDAGLIQESKPYTARRYKLNYNDLLRRTEEELEITVASDFLTKV